MTSVDQRIDLLSATEEFLRAAADHIPEKAEVPPLEIFAKRLAMLLEEVRELFWASGLGAADMADLIHVMEPDKMIERLTEALDGQEVDLVEAVDAFNDTIVIAHGGALEIAGPATSDAQWEVARSNLDKIGADGKVIRSGGGKILKPEGWVGPQIAQVLAMHGLCDRIGVLERQSEAVEQ